MTEGKVTGIPKIKPAGLSLHYGHVKQANQGIGTRRMMARVFENR